MRAFDKGLFILGIFILGIILGATHFTCTLDFIRDLLACWSIRVIRIQP
jgi:Trk-type K+ transport system membrane component